MNSVDSIFARQGAMVAAGCLLLILSGCGGGPGYKSTNVRGSVTLDGRPVAKGYITFTPTEAGAGPATGAAIQNGAFQVKDCPLGQQRATFQLEGEMTTIHDAANNVDRQVPKSINLAPEFAQGVAVTIAASGKEEKFDLKSSP